MFQTTTKVITKAGIRYVPQAIADEPEKKFLTSAFLSVETCPKHDHIYSLCKHLNPSLDGIRKNIERVTSIILDSSASGVVNVLVRVPVLWSCSDYLDDSWRRGGLFHLCPPILIILSP